MAGSRAIGRDVHFYHFADPYNALGGMILNSSVTESSFFMVEIVIDASGPYWVISRSTGEILTLTDAALKRGHYDIWPCSRKGLFLILIFKPYITRVLSRTITGRDDAIRQLVRERDGKCVITGLVNTQAYRNDWTSFPAAHIFPLSSEEYFMQSGLSRCITNKANERDTGINSCQNGLLMQSNVHERFDKFLFSVN
ncbi:HNH endonuclease-domain-containing protein, partial [Lipomyces doorenjongii]|uniref:HNH endonuclease-domain-containing protein n=1 Tax=Lipomyces doorenjongii TaxID=383834 RepID=UPI0034CF5E56